MQKEKCINKALFAICLDLLNSPLIMTYYFLFHSLCHKVLYFGENHLIVRKSLNCKKEQLELQQDIETRTHVEIDLKSWESNRLNHSTFFLFFYPS